MSKKLLVSLGILLVLCSLAYSQERTGNIYGTVTDEEGTALPGVSVKLTGSRISQMATLTSTAGKFRFLSLPPDDVYKLVFELSGFKAFIRENVSVRVGVNVDLNIVMQLGVLEQNVTVTAQTPVVDPKKSTVQTNITRETMQQLPSARDPWVLLEMAAGVLIDRENVGGNESGQQSNFSGRGDSGDNAQWNIDGVNISDPAAVGASPMYYDFDMFEEMNIQTAANDVTTVTGGININFVTPRGGNKFSGGARFYITDKATQAENRPSELEDAALAGNTINSIYDYGFNLGGPILKDKLWFWGSYGTQNIKQFAITGAADNTDLTTYNIKLNAQLGVQRLEAYFCFNTKEKDGRRRTGGYLDEPEATWIQTGPSFVYKLQDEMVFNQNFYLSLKGSYIPMEFSFEPKGGRDNIVYQDMAIGYRYNTGDYYVTHRPVMYGDATANYFLENVLGADHEFKFGVEYKAATVDSATGYGNGIFARLWDGEPYEVRYYNNFFEKFYANRISAYFQDSVDFGKLTLNLGLRYDRQWGGILEGTNEPNDTALMTNVGGVDYSWPSVTQQAGDFPFTFNMISPRIGAIYDLFGNGKTLLKANFSIYGSQFDASAAWVMFFIYGYHRFYWTDTGDNQVQANELTYRSTVDLTPGALTTQETIGDYFDQNISPEKTMEILVGVEHELSADLGVGMNVQYRRMYDFNWNKLLVYDYLNGSAIREVENDDWVESGTINGQTFWDLDYNNVGWTFTNRLEKRPDFYQTYMAVELSLKKRLSNKWMMDASFTLQDHRVFYPSRDSYQDPTDHLPVEKLDGQPMAYQASGSGSSNVYMNTRWMFKLGALYQLPYGFTVSGTFHAREGFISPAYAEDETYYKYDYNFASVWSETFGKTRDPNMYLLNLRLEKKFAVGSFGNVYISVDGFNILNTNTRLARERNQSAPNYQQTLAIMSPRIFRFGVRFEF